MNELEKSAYAYTKKVAKYFHTDDITRYDIYGEPFGKIKNLINKYAEMPENFTQKGFEGARTFDKLYCAAIARTEPAGIEHLKYLRKLQNGEIPQDQEKLRQIAQEINAIEQRCVADGRRYLKVFDTVTDWLKEGKFTLNDIDLG